MVKIISYYSRLLCAASFLFLLGCKATVATECILNPALSLFPKVTSTSLTQSSPMSLTIVLPESLPREGCRVEITFAGLPESSYLGKIYFNPPEVGDLDFYLVKRFAIYGGGEGMAREQPNLIVSIPGELIQRAESLGENRLVIVPESDRGNPIEDHGLVVKDVLITKF